MAEECCKEIVKIIQGRIKRFTINLLKNGVAWNLTGATEIDVCLPNASSEKLSLGGGEVTVLNAGGGLIQVDVPAAKSANLTVGEEQTIEVAVDMGSGKEGLQIEEALTVITSLCPSP